jgi:hypothetical protein
VPNLAKGEDSTLRLRLTLLKLLTFGGLVGGLKFGGLKFGGV